MTDRTFMGMPVNGDICQTNRQQAQPRPIEELHESLLACLSDPNLVSIGWYAYTPYFNDGEPCEFSVGECWFVTTADKYTEDEYGEITYVNEDGEEVDQYEMREHLSMWGHPHLTEDKYNERPDDRKGITFPELAVKAKRFSDDLQSGAFDHDLLAAFGDHCIVTATEHGFQVETYEHD